MIISANHLGGFFDTMINIFETSFEARERRFQIEKLYHGETVDLVGVVTTNGVPQNIMGYAVSGVFQPTSAQGSDDFYELSADIVDNKVVVHWDKGKDFGENSYMVWALLTDGDNASYPIVWRLDMAYSPSYPLSDLAPIPKAIDFSKYDLLNAPWLELSAFDEFVDGLSNEYLPLSGGVVSGDFEVKDFLKGADRSLVIGKNNVQQYSDRGVALGTNLSTNVAAVAIGDNTRAGNSSIAIGQSSEAGDGSGIVIGNNSKTYSNSIAIGAHTSANYSQSIAIGNEASTTKTYEVRLGGPYQSQFGQPSLYVHDIPILSGSDHRIPKDRLPYLSEYAKKEEIPEVPTDLSAFTNSPGYLTAHQSLSDYYTKQEADGKFLTAHQDLTDYATKEFVQSEISDFVTEDALTGLATKEEVQAVDDKLSNYAEKEELTAYAQLSDIPEVPEGDYLPLSGGTLSGRIYLKASQSQVVGSNAVLTDSESDTIYVGSWDESVELTANVTLSVMNAGQDFIDMISNFEEYTGDELTSYTVNAKIQFVGPNGLNKTLNGSATIGFGYYYVSDNSIDFDDSLDADLGHEDESALVFKELVFNMGNGGSEPCFVLRFNVDGGDQSDFSEQDFGYSDVWTVEEIREETETIEPFVISSELPEVSAFATKAELNTKANESDLTALAHDVEDNYCTNRYVSETFATKNELTAYAQLSDIPEVPEGDYLPLSGGNLSGRIYLKTTTGGQTIDTSMVVGYFSDETCNAEISVYASEEYLRSGGGGGGVFVDCSAKVYDKLDDVSGDVSISLLAYTTENEYNGTWSGESEDNGTWSISLDANPSATGNPLFAHITWQGSGEVGMVDADGFPLSNPTADTTVETTTPFVTSADVDAVIGDINSILDSINGQTI